MMNNKKKGRKFISISRFIIFSISLILILLFLFRKDIWILYTHLSHKPELRFVQEFLYDLKNNDIEYLDKYFLDKRIHKILKMIKQYDKALQKRSYIIEEIISNLYDDEKKIYIKKYDWACIHLFTIENGRKLSWLEVFIIKKKGKYYIEKFQFGDHFPLPHNLYD